MNLAEQLEQNEKYDEAYVEYQKLLFHNKADIDLLTKTAHIAKILNKTEDVKKYFSQILELDPENILAHEELLDIFFNEDKFKYYFLRARLKTLQQQIGYAKDDYKKAIKSATDEEEALPARYMYAALCEAQEKHEEALKEYLKIFDYDKKNPVVVVKLAELYEKTEGIQSSISILEIGVNERGFSEISEILAGYYIRNSQPDLALKYTKEDLTKVRALFDLKRENEGFELLMKNKEKNAKNKTFYSLLAQYYYQKNMFDESFEAINEFSKIDNNSPLIYQMRALIYEKKDDKFNAHINWGKYNILRGKKEIALNEYLTAYQFNMNDVDLIETIAVIFETEKDKTKANEFYERILAVDENNKNALQKVAEFKESIGDDNEAYRLLEKLKSLDPINSYADENLARLKEKIENGGFLNKLLSFFGKKD